MNSNKKAYRKAEFESLHKFKLDVWLLMIIIYPLIFLLANSIPLQNYQESHDLVPDEEISLLNIANYFEGTFINMYLGNYYLHVDLGNKGNETKRIIIAIILSIVLIVVLCVFI